jgi:integrase
VNSLSEALEQYIAVRRALGAKLPEPPRTLGQFIAFLQQRGAAYITTELALRWAMQPANVQRATWARRLSMVRRFAMWLQSIDPRTQVPPIRLLSGRHRRSPPRIYTIEEVQRLMGAASKLPSRRGLRAHTYTTIIGLLATTGLRPGEVLALTRPDVDLDSGILFIRESKHGKSRFVPVHESTRQALTAYATRREKLAAQPHANAFFVAESGHRLGPCAVRRTFAELSRAVGLRQPGAGRRIGRGPRLQDFRHTFATRTLINWYKAGVNIECGVITLSTYLGHSDVTHTYWYFSADPELLQLATKLLCGRRPGAAQ